MIFLCVFLMNYVAKCIVHVNKFLNLNFFLNGCSLLDFNGLELIQLLLLLVSFHTISHLSLGLSQIVPWSEPKNQM
jgi:hypothetical protein